MELKLTKKTVVTLIIVIVATTFFVYAQKLVMLLSLFGLAGLFLSFPILGYLPILTVLMLTLASFGAIAAWAIYKKDFNKMIFPGLVLVLPTLLTIILIVFSPITEFLFNFFFFLPFLVILLSVFTGLGAIVVSKSYRQDLRLVLKLIGRTLAAILFSAFLWLFIYLGPLWIALYFMPHWVVFSLLPRVVTLFIAGFVVTYLYWPGKKRGLFLRILGPVILLELLLFLTINLIIL